MERAQARWPCAAVRCRCSRRSASRWAVPIVIPPSSQCGQSIDTVRPPCGRWRTRPLRQRGELVHETVRGRVVRLTPLPSTAAIDENSARKSRSACWLAWSRLNVPRLWAPAPRGIRGLLPQDELSAMSPRSEGCRSTAHALVDGGDELLHLLRIADIHSSGIRRGPDAGLRAPDPGRRAANVPRARPWRAWSAREFPAQTSRPGHPVRR